MTAATLTYHNPMPKFPLFRLLGLLVVFAAVILGAHAVMRHGAEAGEIRQCLKDNGPYLTFRNKFDKDTYYYVCRLGDNKFGLQALKKTKDGLFEKTAFIKGSGTIREVLEYLAKIATPFKGIL